MWDISNKFLLFLLLLFFSESAVANYKPTIIESKNDFNFNKDENRCIQQQQLDLLNERLNLLKERNDFISQKVNDMASKQTINSINIGKPSNCMQATQSTRRSEIYDIIIPNFNPNPFKVFCDEDIDYGGWTVIQRRVDGHVDFNRNWEEYKKGFGELRGEFFIGLDKLHALTTLGQKQELYILMKSFSEVTKYAKYSSFAIGNESENYILKDLGGYRGNAGDALRFHAGQVFSTFDRNNNARTWTPCAEAYKCGWWFGNCYQVLLNGLYFPTKEDGIQWKNFEKEWTRLKFVQMMIRPVTTL